MEGKSRGHQETGVESKPLQTAALGDAAFLSRIAITVFISMQRRRVHFFVLKALECDALIAYRRMSKGWEIFEFGRRAECPGTDLDY